MHELFKTVDELMMIYPEKTLWEIVDLTVRILE